MLKTTFNKKETPITSKLDLLLKKELVKWHIWSIADYGAEALTFWKVEINVLGKKREHRT